MKVIVKSKETDRSLLIKENCKLELDCDNFSGILKGMPDKNTGAAKAVCRKNSGTMKLS